MAYAFPIPQWLWESPWLVTRCRKSCPNLSQASHWIPDQSPSNTLVSRAQQNGPWQSQPPQKAFPELSLSKALTSPPNHLHSCVRDSKGPIPGMSDCTSVLAFSSRSATCQNVHCRAKGTDANYCISHTPVLHFTCCSKHTPHPLNHISLHTPLLHSYWLEDMIREITRCAVQSARYQKAL